MRRFRRVVTSIAGLAVLLTAACASPTEPSEPLPVTRITNGTFSKFTSPQRLVIRSEAGLLAAWAQVFGGPLALPPPLPQVDFSSEMIVLVASGSKPTSGFTITVDSASGTRETASVTVRSISPAPGCAILPAVSNPFDIVRLPQREEVKFVEQSGIQACN